MEPEVSYRLELIVLPSEDKLPLFLGKTGS